MSFMETLMVLLHGGPPTVVCDACKAEVRGDEVGAVEPISGKAWCRPCNWAGRVPDQV